MFPNIPPIEQNDPTEGFGGKKQGCAIFYLIFLLLRPSLNYCISFKWASEPKSLDGSYLK